MTVSDACGMQRHDDPLRLPLRRRRFGRRGGQQGTCSAARAPTSPRWPSIGLPVPPGFTISTEMCARYYDEGRELSRRAARRGRRGHRPYRAGDRQEVRRRRRSAARLGPLGRAGVDAGDDGHRPQPRPQRRDRRGPRRRLGRSRASPGTAIAASSRCMPTSSSASTTALFEEALEIAKEDKGVHLDTELEAEDWRAAGRRATRSWSRRSWAGPSRRTSHEQLWGAIGAVFGSLAVRARQDLSPAQRHPRRLGHRGQRPGDGVRQYGRDLGHRRRLHPRSRRPASALITANI